MTGLLLFFFFNDTATTEIYTLSLHDALPISPCRARRPDRGARPGDDQEGPSRDGGGARGADRGRRQDRPAGAPGALTAVRFRLDTGGQPHHARGPAEEAPRRRRHRARRVGRLGAPRPVTGGPESPRG